MREKTRYVSILLLSGFITLAGGCEFLEDTFGLGDDPPAVDSGGDAGVNGDGTVGIDGNAGDSGVGTA